MRRGWRWAALLPPLLLLIGFALGEATGWTVLRGPLQRQAARAGGVAVDMGGNFRLRLLGAPQLQLGALQVGAAQAVDAPHLLRADGVVLGWTWVDLWRWHRGQALHIRLLGARTLDMRLLRLADGRASWALGAPRPATGEQPAEARPLPRFGRLQVGSGHLVLDDALLDTRLQVDLAGGEGDAAPAAGAASPAGYRATVRGRWHQLPLDLAVRTGAALPLLNDDGDDAAAPVLPLRIEGTAGAARLLFDGSAAALLGARRLDGALQFAGPSLAAVGAPLGLTLPRTPAFALAGRLAHDAGVWSLQAERATIGSSQLAGAFRFDTRGQPPRLSGQLTGRRLLLADLGPAVGTAGEGRGVTTTPSPATPGKVLPQRRFDLPSLRAMDADVTVAIDQLDLGTPRLAPLQAVRGHLLLGDGVLQLQALRAGVAGGEVAGDTRLDGRGDTARWTLDLQVRGLDIAGWVRGLQTGAGSPSPPPRGAAALRRERRDALQAGRQAAEAAAPAAAAAASAPVKSYLTGLLGGGFKLRGQGSSTAQILGTLQGEVRLLLREGTLSHLITEAAGLDLAQALGVLVRGDAPLPLRCARADLAIDHGVVQARRVVLDNRDSTLRVEGQVDLRSEALALRARARPKDFSPLALRAPVLVTGTLAQPRVGLDGRALGVRAAAAVALGVIAAPAAALLPFVDAGRRDDSDPCADAGVPAPASAPR